ncbi:MAG: signal recognition particle protein [Candidatus Aenigmarchaeota archaeon]|nr:signal recognition particle protein [Candidatus Aenigmarchaeota archaeon]
MFDKLKDSISRFAKLGVADKTAVEALVKDIQRSLIQSDVNVKLVFELSKNIKTKALKDNLPPGLTRREHVVNIVYDELVAFLGEKKADINLEKQTILLLGLFGSGKTTTTAKIAKYYQKHGLTVGAVSCDTWRPAAYEQLKALGKQINIDVYGDADEKDPVKIVKKGMKTLAAKDVIIIDSAGRSAIDDELADELKKIDKVIDADEKILVISGDIGQAAETQARTFNDLVGLTGVIVTKMDSSAKGGGALSACHAADVNVKFLGTGEKPEDIELYDPVRFVSRLLGMGDLETLIEKAKDAIDPEKAMDILKGDFDLNSFYDQIESTKKMGSMSKMMEMIPGMGNIKLPKDMLDVQEEKMGKWKFMMDSMTNKERSKPDILDKSRYGRIATGSGTRPEEVRDLIKHYNQTKKMMKKFKSGKMLKRGPMAKMFKGMMGNMG